MAIIYETDQIFTGDPGFISQANPVTQWRRHYENYRYLQFIFENTNDWRERRDANKEMAIAQKKMDRWYSMKKTQASAIEKVRKEVDAIWEGK